MVTIKEAAQGLPGSLPLPEEGRNRKKPPAPPKTVNLPVDEVVLKGRTTAAPGKKEEEYLVATYWG
ncbi:MAG: hypothetical protein M0009_08655 [Deltaproteobacteria bacterium]|nr:hypothetical protein [Deltaproteobacteria bacterium]